MEQVQEQSGAAVRPIVVQGVEAPIFIGDGTFNVLCNSCGALLAEHLPPDCVVAVDIECIKCHAITRTAAWSRSEPLPQTVVSLGESGRLFFGSPVRIPTSPAVVTCDQEIARVDALYRPIPRASGLFSISSEGLDAFRTEIDIYTNSALSKEIGTVKKAASHGNEEHQRAPLAWAIWRVERALKAMTLDLNEDGVALEYITTADKFIGMWRRHPMFPSLVRALVYEFHHAVTMMIVAGYLEEHGNRVGFTDAALHEKKSPDLFANVDLDHKVSIEIKAPGVLQKIPSVSEKKVLDTVRAQLKTAKHQLTGPSGVVVIGSLSEPGEHKVLEALKSLIARADVSQKIAFVVAVDRNLSKFTRTRDGRLEHTSSSQITPLFNPQYKGEVYVSLKR